MGYCRGIKLVLLMMVNWDVMLKGIVIVAIRQPSIKTTRPANQSGVALLQVLLISSIISLLAIRFTQTARDQVHIANRLDARVNAQLAAHSAMNEVIFVILSDTIKDQATSQFVGFGNDSLFPDLKFHGAPIAWREGVTVRVQDLNGLLPQMFPTHFLWRELLRRRGISEEEVENYLGVWRDIQDADNISWRLGESEPKRLNNGGEYLNSYAQNNKVLRWVFADRPKLLVDLLRSSDIDASPETNLLNAPSILLEGLFEDSVQEAFKTLRSERVVGQRTVTLTDIYDLVPSHFNRNLMTISQSSDYVIEVSADLGAAYWREKYTLRMTASQAQPFQIWLKN